MTQSEAQELVRAASAIPSARFQERHLALIGAGSEFAGNSRWQMFPSASRLVSAAVLLRSGNIMLPYGISSGFKSLAYLVGDLRALGNEGLRIIVREQNKTLRLSQATAFMKLGVSMILPKHLSSAEVRLQVQSFEGTLYRAAFRKDVERVIREARFLQTNLRMSAVDFRFYAETLLSTQNSALPHTLVVLHPLTASGRDAIVSSLSRGLRDGVYTAHSEGIWLLLMACKPLDCQFVLERVLGPRFESLLVGWRKIGKSADILGAIDAMHDDPDQTTLLAA